MVDTIEFIVHDCNTRRPRSPQETEEQHQLQPYKHHGNHMLYLALKEEESKYIERRYDFMKNEIAYNADPMLLLGKKTVKRSWVMSPKVMLVSKDEETTFTPNTRGKYNIPSSNYDVIYDIKSSQNDISFRLSVPKYMYGHSLSQYLPNQNSKRFMSNPSRMFSPNYQAEIIVERVTEFIRVFLKDIAFSFNFNIDIDLTTVEIKSVDLCYNQYYFSKEQALAMIDAQKRLYRKKVRKNSPTHKDEKTSLYYRNTAKTFYFKIYHKGSEFNKIGDKSDFKRLMNFNKDYFEKNYESFIDVLYEIKMLLPNDYKKAGVEALFNIYKASASKYENINFVRKFEKLMPYKVFFLLCEADKIVRYEMQFSNTYMSPLYKKNVYCASSKDYKKMMRNHTKVQQYYDHVNKGNIEKAKQFKFRNRLDNQSIREYEAMHNFLDRKNKFFLKVPDEVAVEENSFIKDFNFYKCKTSYKHRLIHNEQATFSTALLKEMNRRFFEEIMEFQAVPLENPMSLFDKVVKHNKEAKKIQQKYKDLEGEQAFKSLTRGEKMKRRMIVFNEGRFKTFFEEMDKGLSLQQIREKHNIKKSAYYDLRSILKMFSLNEQTMKIKHDFSNIRTDYLQYYRLLSDKVFASQFFAPDYNKAMRSDSYQYKVS